MDITPVMNLSRDKVDALLSSVPFYRELMNSGEPWQYDILLQHSRIVNFEPGEIVMNKGDVDTWMYFVLKGNLLVYPSGNPQDAQDLPIMVTPGEVFGDLAMLTDGKRMATVVADKSSREIKVFGTDFSIFGRAEDLSVLSSDTSKLSLKTKLIFYRNMVHGIRWKLESYKMQHPSHELVAELRKIPIYTGPKDGMDELLALDAQARDLVGLLGQWNREFGALDESVKSNQGAINEELVDSL